MMMKTMVAFLGMIAIPAFAADVTATVEVVKDGKPLFAQATKFYALSDQEAADLQKSAAKQLNFAAKQSDKGGPYTIRWTWNTQPTVETSGMKSGAVHATLKQSVKWLADVQADAEKKGK